MVLIESQPTLSLQPMGQTKIDILAKYGNLPEFLPEFTSLTVVEKKEEVSTNEVVVESEMGLEEISRKQLGFHVRDAWEYGERIVNIFRKDLRGSSIEVRLKQTGTLK